MTTNASQKAHYSEQASREILKRAAEMEAKGGGFTREQLQEMATELGIPLETLMVAEEEWRTDSAGADDQAAFDRYRWEAYKRELLIFIGTMVFLAGINLVTGPGSWWVVWPILGGGLYMFTRYVNLQNREGEQYQRQFQAWRANRQLSSPRR